MIPIQTLRSLVEAATRASSRFNVQPWLFSLSPEVIRIHPDLTRRLPISDPENRELFISLGAALENLLIAAGQAGLEAEPSVFPEDELDFCLRVQLRPRPRNEAAAAFGVASSSVVTRRKLGDALVRTLMAEPREPGVSLQIITGAGMINAVAALVETADRLQFRDPAFCEELARWIRFSALEERHEADGLPAAALGLPTHLPHWAGKLAMRLAAPKAHARAEATEVASAAGLAILATDAEDRTSWVSAGRTLQRLLHRLEAHGVPYALLEQLCEVPEVRCQLRETYEGGAAFPQIVVELGRSEGATASRRRPVDELLLEPSGAEPSAPRESEPAAV